MSFGIKRSGINKHHKDLHLNISRESAGLDVFRLYLMKNIEIKNARLHSGSLAFFLLYGQEFGVKHFCETRFSGASL